METTRKPTKNAETIIIVQYGEIKQLAKIFFISIQSVRKILRGDTSVRKYKQVRKAAIERGGKEVQLVINQ